MEICAFVIGMTTIADDIKRVIDRGESLSPNRLLGGLKHVIVMEGKEREFESLFRELVVEVRRHDKGCNYYDLYKSEQPRTYLVMEQYENRDALQKHQKSEHGAYYFPRLRKLLENIEVNDFECSVQLKSI
jgi:quinol monooxygenase YgiN